MKNRKFISKNCKKRAFSKNKMTYIHSFIVYLHHKKQYYYDTGN